MALTTLTDRRNGRSPLRILSLDKTSLTWRDAGSDSDPGIASDIGLDDIRQVRLSVEMAGQASQVVCRVTDRTGNEIAFGSMRCTGAGQWEANARDFREFLVALHLALENRPGPVRYIEGSSVKFLATMTSIGGVLTIICAAAFTKLFLIDENAIGLVLIPAVALGVWMMRLFWPRAPKLYDPATYTSPPESEEPSTTMTGSSDMAGNEGSVTPR